MDKLQDMSIEAPSYCYCILSIVIHKTYTCIRLHGEILRFWCQLMMCFFEIKKGCQLVYADDTYFLY